MCVWSIRNSGDTREGVHSSLSQLGINCVCSLGKEAKRGGGDTMETTSSRDVWVAFLCMLDEVPQ